jgi:hypothetical protein
MRILGKRSLAATLKFFVDLSYYLLLFFGVVLVLVVTVVPFLTNAKVTSEIPVRFELDRQGISEKLGKIGSDRDYCCRQAAYVTSRPKGPGSRLLEKWAAQFSPPAVTPPAGSAGFLPGRRGNRSASGL